MSAPQTIKTIVIIGATSGIGEQFARRFHALGKKVIITGRRAERLSSLKSELGSNVESYQWDITDFENLSAQGSQILSANPDINSVFIVSGLGSLFSFLDPSTSTEAKIIAECNTNVTAQMLLARIFVPHLHSLALKGEPATLLLMGSGMGFLPLGFFPVYSATKTATHSLAIALRQQISRVSDANAKGKFNVVEVVAPYVATDFGKDFRNASLPTPLPLKEFMDDAMVGLDEVDENGKPPKEVTVGSAKPRAELWRASIGKYMNEIGLDC
ncbi:hypothetical protein BP5796_04275 [Coleophoma crateriformis]|uniref:Uncharacterized protein n=1 Tax=Coleophoma crateriformis TaxID=565419 RepID=A0A3D8SI04_9HELO|nr:hypothetical protein BP5796_04275 [Coleophoma crateriformis]